MECMYTLKVNRSCGRLDFIHLGEGICPEFEKGKSPKETEKESEVEESEVRNRN